MPRPGFAAVSQVGPSGSGGGAVNKSTTNSSSQLASNQLLCPCLLLSDIVYGGQTGAWVSFGLDLQ